MEFITCLLSKFRQDPFQVMLALQGYRAGVFNSLGNATSSFSRTRFNDCCTPALVISLSLGKYCSALGPSLSSVASRRIALAECAGFEFFEELANLLIKFLVHFRLWISGIIGCRVSVPYSNQVGATPGFTSPGPAHSAVLIHSKQIPPQNNRNIAILRKLKCQLPF